jgi:nucleoside-diphosphate-sugar epimerase
MEMTNLVTSPFGVGEKLILELLERGESVYTVFPSPKNVPMSFLGKINLKYGFVQFDRDVYLDKTLPRKVKYVYHLHELYSGPFTRLFKSNPVATLSLLEWARNVGVSSFVYLSSGEIYGKGKYIDESAPHDPHTFYATTKFETEILFRYFHKSLNIGTVRVFFPFGKDVDGYVAQLYQSVTSGDSIETEYRTVSTTFIDDLVGPLLRMRDTQGGGTYNICGEAVGVEELVNRMKSLCGSSPKRVACGTIELTGNSTKAQKELGFTSTPLDDALKRTFST